MNINNVGYYERNRNTCMTAKSALNKQNDNAFVEEAALLAEREKERNEQIKDRGFELFAPNAPQGVKDAFSKAEQETGMSGYGIDGSGKLTHISAMFTLQAEQRLSTGRSDFLGNSKGSAMDAAKKALERLNNPLMPENNPAIQALIEKEKLFYKAFINNLNKL